MTLTTTKPITALYTIYIEKQTNLLHIKNSEASFSAEIYLDQGASLQSLKFGNHHIIQNMAPLSYNKTYASSILFPFANRIKDGNYQFEGNAYNVETNVPEENNALHGFVYDKTFDVEKTSVSKDSATVSLVYTEETPPSGFPYAYTVRLKYVFKPNGLSLTLEITNLSDKKFPFTLGWHPYFVSSDLHNSEIVFNSKEKLILDDRKITTGTSQLKDNPSLKIQDKQFDDCWILSTDEVLFKTPNYNLKFNATGHNNFLQIYTPPRKNTIAIEPTTGIPDSFNNKIGLETLSPGDTHAITWQVQLTDN